MSNRRFDMYQYRQIIFRLRQGDIPIQLEGTGFIV